MTTTRTDEAGDDYGGGGSSGGSSDGDDDGDDGAGFIRSRRVRSPDELHARFSKWENVEVS